MARSPFAPCALVRAILIFSSLVIFALPAFLPAQQTIGVPLTPNSAVTASPGAAPSTTVPAHADLRPTTRLAGHLPSWAQPNQDAGPVPDTDLLHLDLLLARPAARQAAFDHVLSSQQDPKSPLFHAWLTPAQIGLLYGPAQSDIDALTAWLTAQGLQVDEVTPSHTFIRVSAPTASVARAFATSFRLFTLADGRQLRSATTEPAIPTAFTGLVTAIAGLSDAPELPASHMQPAQSEAAPGTPKPQYTSSSTGNHYIAPGDFAILYDVPAAVTSGTGQKVAIIGRSRVNPADITNYLTSVGLPVMLPNVIIPPLGLDPGQTATGDQGEATLDVQRVLGTAPGVQADLVISSNAGGGLRTAIQYNIQTLLDPVMTISFGACEASAGYANTQLYTALFSQAAAEGISVFVSAGDSAAAGCDADFTTPPTTTQIASINYICSSGFATCVGGTEFNDTANPAQYWNATNSSTRTSVLSYIPEGVWNEPMSLGATPALQVAGGGGGVSIYTAKPDFQAGPGVPADGFRDVPDVSFTSAGHDSYFGCFALGSGPCTTTNGLFYYVNFYGTSAAAPSMAAVAALLDQQQGAPQGNLNPLLYRLGANAANGVFHDATVASSGVTNCTAAVPSLCNNSTASATALTGGLAGYLLTPGYDLASGLGSPDVSKFLAAAASAAGLPTVTALTGSSGVIPSGQSLSFSVSVTPAKNTATTTPSGNVQFFANGSAFGTPVPLINGKAGITLPDSLPIGANLVTATYSGDSTFAASNSTGLALSVSVGVTPSTTILTAVPNPVFTNQRSLLTITVASANGSGPTPTGTVSVGGASSVLYNGVATFNFGFSAFTFPFSATYSGSGLYAASTSPVVNIVSKPGPTTTVLTGNTSLAATAPLAVTASVSVLSPFPLASSVTFLDGTTVLGSQSVAQSIGAASASLAVTYTGTAPLTTGYHSITAVFGGDANILGSTSAPLIVAVGIPQAITVAPAPTSLTLTAGATTANTSVLSVASVGAFAGNVSFACTIAYTGTATATFPPTCTASPASVALASQGTASTTLTIGTTVPHALSGPGRSANLPPNSVWKTSAAVALALFAWIPFSFKSGKTRRRKLASIFTAALLAASFFTLSGCGGKSTTPAPIPPAPLVGTTPGPYTITIVSTGTGTATATVSATTTIALTVQ